MAKKPTKVQEIPVNYDSKAKVIEEWVGNQDTSGGIKSQWWKVEPENMFKHIAAVTSSIIENQSYRQAMNLRYARLYANMELSGFGAGMYDRVNNAANSNKVSYNVVKACIDSAAAKIAKQRPRIVALTSGGSWSLQQRSKKLSKYLAGTFSDIKAYPEMTKVFIDSCVFGTGALKVFQDGEKIRCERVFINELVVDDAESIYGMPRQMHQIKYINRDVLCGMFPEFKGKILSSNSGMSVDSSSTSSYAADHILVRESWHLRSGKNVKDGKHVISIENCTLHSEDFDKDEFPFIFLRWSNRLLGFFGAGIAEELIGLQIEINKLLRDIQSAQNLACVPRILIESGSSVVEDHINNKIGSIIKYTGTAPTIVTANAMPTELYQHLETLYAKSFQITGISQLSASSQKPAGLNSGVALREYQDIETERFSLISQAYEDSFIELGNRCIVLAQELSESKKDLSMNVVGANLVEEIKWNDIKVGKNQFILQLYPASLLPTQPSGRLQRVQELLQSGLINPITAKSLLDFPDVEDAMDNELAEYNDINATLEYMLETKEYSAPEPFMNPELCITIAKSQYLRAKTKKVDESDLELFRRFIEDAAALVQNAMPQEPAPPMGAMPQESSPMAVPEALPMSDLIPQV